MAAFEYRYNYCLIPFLWNLSESERIIERGSEGANNGKANLFQEPVQNLISSSWGLIRLRPDRPSDIIRGKTLEIKRRCNIHWSDWIFLHLAGWFVLFRRWAFCRLPNVTVCDRSISGGTSFNELPWRPHKCLATCHHLEGEQLGSARIFACWLKYADLARQIVLIALFLAVQ